MTRVERNVNVGAVIVPFLAFLVAVPLLWNRLVGVTDLVLFAVMYVLCGVGVTVGFHRLLTHRSFATYKPLQYIFAVLGSMAVQGPVIGWVADHRKHHAHADEEGDPHSPHVGHDPGVRGVLSGLWHAHVGWLFTHQGRAQKRRYAPDLTEDAGMRFISRNFLFLVIASLGVPALGGFLLTGSVAGALTGLLWGGRRGTRAARAARCPRCTTTRGDSTRRCCATPTASCSPRHGTRCWTISATASPTSCASRVPGASGSSSAAASTWTPRATGASGASRAVSTAGTSTATPRSTRPRSTAPWSSSPAPTR